MFDHIHETIKSCDAVESVTAERYSPTAGIIYLQLETDDRVAPQLRHYQPANSAVVVDDGDIIEFDVRLGKWTPEDEAETIRDLKKAVREARRETHLPPLKVDQGGGPGFVPHVRIVNHRVPAKPFTTFLQRLTLEVSFLKTHRSAATDTSRMSRA